MLGILILYFIGQHFYKLAEEHSKSKWGFAILGVVTYYASAFLFGMILQIILTIFSKPDFIENMSRLSLGLIELPMGVLGCYGLYSYLKKTWSSKREYDENEINDIGLEEQDNG